MQQANTPLIMNTDGSQSPLVANSSSESKSATGSHWWRTETHEDSLIFSIFKWACTVLTVAASLVFGIWAPLSYRAAIDNNGGQSAAQTSALSVSTSSLTERCAHNCGR